MRQFGLIGYPLEHSFSPAYFAEKFRKEGIVDCQYSAFPLRNIIELNTLLQQHPSLEGLNVTLPYKGAVVPFLHQCDSIVENTGACNCIVVRNGNLTGYNTDVPAFRQTLKPVLKPWHTRALILGSGGAAKAVAYVLEEMGIQYRFVSRGGYSNNSLLTYADLTGEMVSQYFLVINTTPLGMYPDIDSYPDFSYSMLTDKHLCYDLVYNPETTVFLRLSAQMGAAIKNGMEMLYLQAEESWNLWNRSA